MHDWGKCIKLTKLNSELYIHFNNMEWMEIHPVSSICDNSLHFILPSFMSVTFRPMYHWLLCWLTVIGMGGGVANGVPHPSTTFWIQDHHLQSSTFASSPIYAALWLTVWHEPVADLPTVTHSEWDSSSCLIQKPWSGWEWVRRLPHFPPALCIYVITWIEQKLPHFQMSLNCPI